MPNLNPTERDVLIIMRRAGHPLAFKELVRILRETVRPNYSEHSIKTALSTLSKKGLAGWACTPAGMEVIDD